MSLAYTTVPLQVKGVNLELSTIHRLNSTAPVLFLHGFGSCKEDLADFFLHPTLEKYGFIAYDAPGCGNSTTDDLSAIDMPFLLATVEEFLAHFGISQIHIIGHSMGGLTALLFAHRHPGRVLSFVDIKGNLAPEDCFLSRQTYEHPSKNPDEFFEAFIDRTRNTKSYSSPLFASVLRTRVRAAAVKPIFESMVRYSDEDDLVTKFIKLECPRMFVFGEENQELSYLERLGKEGVQLALIPESGHFPMYANPVEMYRRIAGFLDTVETGQSDR
ncbi:hypothetical protein N7470_003593 [Penicillium chermesinum]|nr:hypothetical protein N7470_003593 [Penicillium chermesinum]